MQYPFESTSEVEFYLGCDEVKCLICGRYFVSLPPHLRGRHNTTSEAYRLKFGIPFKYGLAGKAFRQAAAERMQMMIGKGLIQTAPAGHVVEHKQPKRRVVSLVRQQNLKRILQLQGKNEPNTPDIYREFLKRMAQGRSQADVARDADMPASVTFFKYLRKDPELKAAFDTVRGEALKSARDADQTKGAQVAELRAQGWTWKQISTTLKCPVSTVRNILRRHELIDGRH